MMGVVEQTCLRAGAPPSPDKTSSHMGLLGLQKMACELETAPDHLPAAHSLTQTQTQHHKHHHSHTHSHSHTHRKTLKRLDSQLMAGVTSNRRKLRHLLCSESVSSGARITRAAAGLVEAVGTRWLRARHLADMLHCFPLGAADEVHTFGSYKVELVVSEGGRRERGSVCLYLCSA